MSFSLGRKVAASFGISLAILLVITVASYRATTALIENSAWVEHSHAVLLKLETILSLVKDLESGRRGYVITSEDRFLEAALEALSALPREIGALKALTADNPHQQRNLEVLEPVVARAIDFTNETVSQQKLKGKEAAEDLVRTGRGVVLMEEMSRVIERMTGMERELLASRDREASESARRATNACILGCILAFFLAGLSGLLIRRDFMERRAADEALRGSEERMARIVETVADGIVIADRDGQLSFANAAAEKVLGLSRSAITQRKYDDAAWEVTTADGKPCPSEDLPVARVLKEGASIYGSEVGIVRRDGGRCIVSCNAAPLRDSQGTVTGVVVSVSDVTRRKELERLKDDFVSTVSHELRTPLSSLRGFAELMLTREFKPEKQREFLGIIHSEAVRLTNLINDFLDIQRMESGRQMYEFKASNLSTILTETVAVFSQDEGNHDVRLEAPRSLPLVWGDPARLRQVAQNLISNALKFSPGGTRVTVRAWEQDDSVVVSVTDKGMGISEETKAKLFSKFFRAETAETRNVGGTGLGLALVKEIVEAHNGRVWVESAVGQGSTFFFSLPVARQPVEAPSLGGPPARDGIDVLLIEDDQAFARLLSEHFEAEGLRVTTVSRAEDGLELIRGGAPRLALVDIHLGGRMDGWDLLVSVKSDADLRTLPILIISASDTINARGLAVGGVDYLLKPITAAWLLQAVHRQLPSLEGKHVLLADDDEAFRRQVRECLLAETDVQLTEAANGQEALACMAKRMPDLLLLDLLMPDMDGFEVLNRLRADKRAVNLPVLVITGKELSPEDKAYLKRRMGTLVRKREVNPDHIAKVAQQILSSRWEHEEAEAQHS